MAVFTWSSCTDLVEKPIGILAPESFFRTRTDVESAIFGGYARLSSEPLYGRQFNSALQLRSDMVDIGDRGTPAERQQVNDFTVDANNGMVARWWLQFYQIISAENAAIAGAGLIDISEEVRNELIAEARFLRGYAYFHLVQLHGEIPYIEEMVTDPASVKTVEKSTVEVVYQKIIDDFGFAKEHLPDRQPNDVRSRPTKGTAASFLALVHLTRGDYQNAATEAQWVISNKARFNYELAADYQALFDATRVKTLQERIFVIDYLSNFAGQEGGNINVMGTMTGIWFQPIIPTTVTLGWSVLVPSLEAYHSWDSRDYRKSVSFDTVVVEEGIAYHYSNANHWTVPRPHQAKYTRFPGPEADAGRNNSSHDFHLMRYAEVLLIAAEALAEVNNGPTPEAEGYLNEVRARARNWAGTVTSFPEDVSSGLSKDAFIDLVMEERRLELAFEFKRWYDIKRRQLGVQVFTGANSLEPHANFDPARDYLFPIPGQELDRSPNLLPQNPGY